MQDDQGNPMVSAIAGEPVEFVLSYETNIESYQDVTFRIWIRDAFLKGIIYLSNALTGENFDTLKSEDSVICRIDRFPLREGRYYLDLGIDVDGAKADRLLRAVTIDVVNGPFFETGKVPRGANAGDYLCDHSWYFEK
jgi:hypothetical protein